MAGRDAGKGKGEVRLFEIVIAALVGALELGGLRRVIRAVGQPGKQAIAEVHQFLVRDCPRADQHRGTGAVVRGHVMLEIVPRESGDGFFVAENGPAHRLVRVTRGLQIIEDEIVGRIARLADFLDDDAALALQFASARRPDG